MPYKDKEKARQCSIECKKRYRDKHREQGLCRDCSNPIVDGKTRCEACQDKVNKRSIEWQKSHKEIGLCVHCNQPRAENNSEYCLLHLDKQRRSNRRYRENPLHAMHIRKYHQARYNKLKSENKCIGCGMPLNTESRMGLVCVNCYISCNNSKHTSL